MIRNLFSTLSTNRFASRTAKNANNANNVKSRRSSSLRAKSVVALAFAVVALAGSLMAAPKAAQAYWVPGPPIYLPGYSYVDAMGNIIIVPGKWMPGQPVWVPEVIVRPY